MSPEFHPAAVAELAAAVTDGAIHGRDVGKRLRDEASRITQLLCDTPRIGEPLTNVYRRFPLKGFPFVMIYRIDEDTLRIVAFAHRRRRPGYCRRRK